jgi:predicted small metal-binding protein
MAKQITCRECGHAIRGDTDEEVIAGTQEHMRAEHPELLSTVAELDLAGWIEEI